MSVETVAGKKVSNTVYECKLQIRSVCLVSFNIHDSLGHPGTPSEIVDFSHYVVSNDKTPIVLFLPQ